MAATHVSTYDEDKEKIKAFLQDFTCAGEKGGAQFKYANQLQLVANRELATVTVDIDDILSFGDADLVEAVQSNTPRYSKLFAEVIDELKPASTVESHEDANVLDIFIQHRNVLAANNATPGTVDENRRRYPPDLLRRYDVSFNASSQQKPSSVRAIKAEQIGHLVKVEGIVTRCTGVKPSITVATYACDQCGCENYQEITGPSFMPLQICTSEDCTINRRNGRLHLQTRGSKFVKFQELKIQELSKHVPTGHIPRSLTVYARGERTRIATPGDQITVTGVFLPTPYAGFRQIRAGLLSDTYLEAQIIQKEKKNYSEHVLTEEMREEIDECSMDSEIYDKLSSSIAPEIYGHEDVKKALLLLLVGGSDRNMRDGMKIRGDINICLMGDPGVAKSQLLKTISILAPRGVYTTGRGSSGVGLTAAVTRDPITGEMVLEGGALVLSDMGVCCIDEFDKMEEGDRTSIHEVMEQQTISIAKGGIQTTLNARSSILAAANPLYGRYNPRKTATQNINLPAALLTRFDLVFLLLDRPDLDADLKLAHHITYVHTHNDFPPLEHEPMTKEFVRNYVSVAKSYTPIINKDLTDYLAGIYVDMREASQHETETMTYTSARTLLAIMRLSTSLARLRFSEEVVKDDVDEALRLMHMSRASVQDSKAAAGKKKNYRDAIYDILAGMLGDSGNKIKFADAQQRVTSKGFNPNQFEETLNEYEMLDVLQVNRARTQITFSGK